MGLGNRQTENSYTVRRADNLNDKVKGALRKTTSFYGVRVGEPQGNESDHD